MTSWEELILGNVARISFQNPRLQIEQALERALEDLQVEGKLAPDQVEVLRATFQNSGTILSHHAVINPRVLRRAGKKLFIFIIDAHLKSYVVLRRLTKTWPGETSLYVLFGDKDVLLTLYGSDMEKEAWLEHVHAKEFIPNILNVVDVPYFKGHITKAAQIGAGMGIPAKKIDSLVDNYWDPNLQDMRVQLEREGILLGPGIKEDVNKTGRVKAFIGVLIEGPHPKNRQDFATSLLETEDVKNHVFSIYHCEGSFTTVIQVVCDSVAELDKFTDLIQRRPGGGRIETTTFVVAATVNENFPKLLVRALPPVPVAVDVLGTTKQRIMNLGVELLAEFDELSPTEQLFLIQALTELEEFALPEIEPRWQDEIEKGKENLIRGFIRKDKIDLKDSIGSLARAVEGPCKRAVRTLVEVFYERDYGAAQQDLKLRSTKFGKFTIGNCRNAFQNITEDPRYRIIGTTFPAHFLTKLEWFEEHRDELIHDPTPERYEEDFNLFVREAREAWGNGLELIGWLLKNVLQRDLSRISMSQALRLLEVLPHGKFEKENRHTLTAVKGEILQHMEQINREHRGRIEEIVTLLTRLTFVSEAKYEEEEQVWHMFDAVIRNQEEILKLVNPKVRADSQEKIEHIKQIGRDVGMGTLTNFFWYLILNTPPSQVLDMLTKLLS